MKLIKILNNIYKYRIQYLVGIFVYYLLSAIFYIGIPLLGEISMILYLYIIIYGPFDKKIIKNENNIKNNEDIILSGENIIKKRKLNDIKFNIHGVLITFLIVTLLKILLYKIFCGVSFCGGMLIIITIPTAFLFMIIHILSLKYNYEKNSEGNWLEYTSFGLFICSLIAGIFISFL